MTASRFSVRWSALAMAGVVPAGLVTARSSSKSSGGGASAGSDSTKTTVTIGELADLTGTEAAQWGTSSHQGIELAIEDVNQSGVLGNTKLALDSRDEASVVANGLLTTFDSSEALVLSK
jgi:branched-chain amino acid transport system substrate-binding protein